MPAKKIVVLTGAGVSAESGLSTFRDAGGLWEGYDVYEVASPQGWAKDKELVLKFYNMRRRQLKDAKPNTAHYALAELEKKYEVIIITQNVDDLHERAGSTNVVHLHGELTKARSTVSPYNIYEIGYNDIDIGDKCEKGGQLRPHIVWFGEPVPLMTEAAQIAASADLFIVVGTSLVVYPAAGLLEYVSHKAPKYIIDPAKPNVFGVHKNIEFHVEKATVGTPKLVERLMKE
ncbi:NAD-dependent deacylase [bacterium]|nr:MAG: NAD-dependent deacylase [bacterium]